MRSAGRRGSGRGGSAAGASAKGARKGGDRRGSGSRAGHSAGRTGRGLAQRPGAGRGRGLEVAKRGAERVRARRERGRGVCEGRAEGRGPARQREPSRTQRRPNREGAWERGRSVWGFGVVRERLGSKTNETLRGKGPVASDLQSVCVGVRHGWNVSEKLEK